MQCVGIGSRTQNFLRAGSALWLFSVTCGCHAVRPNPPAAESTKVVARAVQLRSVMDPTGRWRSQITTPDPPKLHALPGHVRLDLLPDSHLATNCFVYEQPILAGEATAQLLHAIAPGLRFKEFSVVDIQELNHSPLVTFSLQFETTLGEKEQGEIEIFVLPRLDHPAMCSVEVVQSGEQQPSAQERNDAKRMVQEFLTHLSATHPVSIDLDEMWLIKQQERTVGFRHVRIEKVDNAYATVVRMSRFSLAPDSIVNSDRIEQQLEDESGLVRMTWLQLTEGRVELRGQVERQDDGYRYGSETHGAVSNGRFSLSTSLLGSVSLHRAVARGREGEPFASYLPDVRVDGAASCAFEPAGSEAQPLCLRCAHPNDTTGVSVSAADFHQTLPAAVSFEVGPSGALLRVDGQADCRAQTQTDSPSEEQALVARHGAWPSF